MFRSYSFFVHCIAFFVQSTIIMVKEMICMATTNISIRMDSDLKAQADALFSELGMNLSTAFNIILM